MDQTQLNPDQILQISRLVSEYLATHRDKFSPQAALLTAAQKAAMAGFFQPQVLDTVRVLVLHGSRVENPLFYPFLSGMGFSNLPDFSRMAAITFYDVVVSHQAFTRSLLFHELVHVEQYRQLGVPRFSELYVKGFLAGGSYDSIPLEVNACTLARRFEKNPQEHFRVVDEVLRWMREERF